MVEKEFTVSLLKKNLIRKKIELKIDFLKKIAKAE
jgi:hypothetical protein